MISLNLSTHYNKIYEEAIPKIMEDNYQLDDQIDSLSDNKFGITLLIRPTIEIKNTIQEFLEGIKQLIPSTITILILTFI